jgi:GDP-L-fucose synthase
VTGTIPPKGCYCVLGASGLAGSHALKALCDVPGVEVRAVCHSRPPRIAGKNIQVFQADLSVPYPCPEAFEGADYALIFAGVLSTSPVLASDPVSPVLANLRIAVNCLEAAYRAGVAKCVWLSSTTGYPAGDETHSEDRMFHGDPPGNWYALGWMTRYVETVCRAFSERFPRKMPVIALRPTMMYGEFDHFDEETAHFLPSLVRRVVNRERPIEVWGTGEQTRDLIYAGDVVDAAFAAVEKLDRHAAFNVASGKSHSVNEILRMVLELDQYSDSQVVRRADKPTSISQCSFSNTKAMVEIDFKPSISISEGLRKTIEWYRNDVVT